MRFRLAAGVEEEAFLRADRSLQEEFAYQQPGLLRRTTARDDAGNWIVIDLWRSAADAAACATRWESDQVARRFMDLVDGATVRTERYVQLD